MSLCWLFHHSLSLSLSLSLSQSPEDGSVTSKWEGVRLHAIATHPSSSVVFAADSHMRVKQYDFQEKTSEIM